MENAPLLVLKELSGNDPTALSPFQKFLAQHLATLEALWWTLWVTVLVYLVVCYIIKPLWQSFRTT
jgi:hypothetical protein